MARTHEAEMVRDPSKRIVIEDAIPLPSARLFKHISDELWKQRPNDDDWAAYGVASVLTPRIALAMMNNVVGAIDARFVLAGIGKDLELASEVGEPISISGDALRI